MKIKNLQIWLGVVVLLAGVVLEIFDQSSAFVLIGFGLGLISSGF